MAAYIVVDSAVHDLESFKAYSERVGAVLEAHGGKPIAVAEPEHLEGQWFPSRVVILEFPDEEAARGWYNSSEYQEIIPLRQRAAEDGLVLVQGL